MYYENNKLRILKKDRGQGYLIGYKGYVWNACQYSSYSFFRYNSKLWRIVNYVGCNLPPKLINDIITDSTSDIEFSYV